MFPELDLYYRLVQAYRPKFVKHPMPTPFFEVYHKFGRTCSMSRCQPFTECIVFVAGYVFFFILEVYIWVLGDPKFPAKIQIKLSSTAWKGLIEHVYSQDLSPKNSVDIWTFARKTCAICVVAS